MIKPIIVNVGGYTRISLDEKHQPYSLSAQEDRIREYTTSRTEEGYRVYKIYTDTKSAATLDRPGLQNVLRDIEKGLLQVVLVVKLDRLCRNLADQLYLTEEFKKAGVRLEATNEDVDVESPEGTTWAQIRGAFNELERRRISCRTKMGMAKKASLGGWCGGYAPFGYSYDANAKILIPDPYQRLIVENIFDLYVTKKMGAKSIAVDLNGEGFRTRSGHPFSVASVIAIITNPVYIGKIRWGGKIFLGKHERLTDEETFDKSQAILSERRGDPSLRRSNASDYPLSGLLRCQRCGRRLVGVSAHGRNGIYRYYACPGRLEYGECDLEYLPKERIDLAILSQIKRIFADDRLISSVVERVNMKRMENLPKKHAELSSLESQVSQKKATIQKYLSTFESIPIGKKS